MMHQFRLSHYNPWMQWTIVRHLFYPNNILDSLIHYFRSKRTEFTNHSNFKNHRKITKIQSEGCSALKLKFNIDREKKRFQLLRHCQSPSNSKVISTSSYASISVEYRDLKFRVAFLLSFCLFCRFCLWGNGDDILDENKFETATSGIVFSIGSCFIGTDPL